MQFVLFKKVPGVFSENPVPNQIPDTFSALDHGQNPSGQRCEECFLRMLELSFTFHFQLITDMKSV